MKFMIESFGGDALEMMAWMESLNAVESMVLRENDKEHFVLQVDVYWYLARTFVSMMDVAFMVEQHPFLGHSVSVVPYGPMEY